MKNIVILISLFLATEAFGRIEIVNSFPASSPSDCSGGILLSLTGTGGDFTVIVEETGQILEGVEGNVLIEQLCVGNYTIVVSLSSFPQCETVLNTEIVFTNALQGGGSTLPNPNESLSNNVSESNFDTDHTSFSSGVQIVPNPSTGLFKILFQKGTSLPVEYKIFNANGQLILTSKQTESEEKVNLSSYPTGTYFIHLFYNDELYETKEIIIKS